MKLMMRTLAGLVLASLFPVCTVAQQTPPSNSGPPQPQSPSPAEATEPAPQPDAPAKQSQTGARREQEKQTEPKEESKRVLGVLPQFGVTSDQDAPPLSRKEKFHLFAKSAFDPVSIGVAGVEAGLSQAEDQFPGYGQGAQGYGKRFGAALADEVSSGFWSNFFYPTLLKQDPRYFRLGEGGYRRRFLYSMKQEFVCHTDQGGRSFHWSNVLGAFTAGAISNLYYPGNTLIRVIPATSTTSAVRVYENDRGVSLTLSRSAIALGYGMAGGLVDEFWPDIRSKVFHKHKKNATAPPPSRGP